MRRKGIKLTAILLLVGLLSAFCFTSCGTVDLSVLTGSPYGDADGSKPPIVTSPFNDKNNSFIDQGSGDTIQNTITIEGNSSNIAFAASAGVRSAVSVYATFSAGRSAGSGVIYKLDAESGSAFIVTNYHIIYYSNGYTAEISDEIYVFLYGLENQAYAIPAKLVGGSPNYDIAVLRVDSNAILKSAAQRGSAVAATVADSNMTTIGDTAIAIGNPKSAGISITSGVVSVDSEYIMMTSINSSGQVGFRVMRIDTAVNSGNSGGGLFNDKGELIGIVNAKINNSTVENIGYAIPSNIARAVADNIIDNCYGKSCNTVMRPILGVTLKISALSTKYDAELGKMEKIEEIIISEISEGGISEGKFQVGDILKSVKLGEKEINITRRYHGIEFMLDARVGDTVEFTVIRGGAEQTVTVTITEACLRAY